MEFSWSLYNDFSEQDSHQMIVMEPSMIVSRNLIQYSLEDVNVSNNLVRAYQVSFFLTTLLEGNICMLNSEIQLRLEIVDILGEPFVVYLPIGTLESLLQIILMRTRYTCPKYKTNNQTNY